jgi:hypothetical protein
LCKHTYTRVDEKTFEATDPGFHQRQQLIGIPRHDATVKANVDPALPLASSQLLLEAHESGGGRDGVQGHIDDGGNTAGSRGLRSRVETFPFCAARLVKMDVGVDQAREQEFGAIVLV